MVAYRMVEPVLTLTTDRLRICQGPNCSWLFIDSSKAGPVDVGATWRFAGTPPSFGASTHARVSGARVDMMIEGDNQLVMIKKACCVRAREGSVW